MRLFGDIYLLKPPLDPNFSLHLYLTIAPSAHSLTHPHTPLDRLEQLTHSLTHSLTRSPARYILLALRPLTHLLRLSHRHATKMALAEIVSSLSSRPLFSTPT